MGLDFLILTAGTSNDSDFMDALMNILPVDYLDMSTAIGAAVYSNFMWSYRY